MVVGNSLLGRNRKHIFLLEQTTCNSDQKGDGNITTPLALETVTEKESENKVEDDNVLGHDTAENSDSTTIEDQSDSDSGQTSSENSMTHVEKSSTSLDIEPDLEVEKSSTSHNLGTSKEGSMQEKEVNFTLPK